MVGPAVSHIDNIPISVGLNNTAHDSGAHAVVLLVKLGVFIGHAVGLSAGVPQDLLKVQRTVHPRGELCVDIGHKGLVGKLACQSAGLCSAHTVAERHHKAVLGIAFFDDKAVLIVLSDLTLVRKTKAFHSIRSFNCIPGGLFSRLHFSAKLAAGSVHVSAQLAAHGHVYPGVLQNFDKRLHMSRGGGPELPLFHMV